MKGRKTAEKILVPALAGVLIFIVTRLVGMIPLDKLAESAGAALKDFIDSVPFPDSSTSSLIKALLTGERSSLGREAVQIFRDSGASHILALSGLHLGFIYGIVKRISSILGNSLRVKKARAALIICFSIFYTLMTGASPSIVRAMFFIIINEVCSLDAERERGGIRVLFLALLLQLAFNPGALHTIGFQLSYLAVAGLYIVGIPLQRWFPAPERFSLMKRIWDSLAISIGCQLFTAPLAWHYFHSFPTHFLLTNLLALPLTSAIMALAILTLFLQALGLCPAFLLILCNKTTGLLLEVLETIAGM